MNFSRLLRATPVSGSICVLAALAVALPLRRAYHALVKLGMLLAMASVANAQEPRIVLSVASELVMSRESKVN